jgi:hypothetical protein
VWALVVRAYNAPASAPSSGVVGGLTSTLPVFTSTLPANTLVNVPPLQGLSLGQASQQLSALGLQPKVIEERPDVNATESKVLEQRPAPGTQLSAGGFVELVVSKPTQAQVVPTELMGQLFTDGLSQTLQTVGWRVVREDTFSVQPEGTIISLQPPAGTKLAMSDTLTVTVSTGGRIDLKVDMSPVILDSARFGQERYAAGQTIQFSVLWRAVGNVGHDYRVFVHMLRPDGNPVEGIKTNGDRTPRNNGADVPTSGWTAGMLINDTYEVILPANIPAGNYLLEVGLYDDQGRLRVNDYGQTPTRPDGVNSVLVRRVRVG